MVVFNISCQAEFTPTPNISIPRIKNKWWRFRLLLNPYSGAFVCYPTRGAGFVCFCCMRICTDI